MLRAIQESRALYAILQHDAVADLELYLRQTNNHNMRLVFDDPDCPEILRAEPPLVSVAAILCAVNCFHLLVMSGADLTIPDNCGRLPIHFACCGGDVDIVDYFDTLGCDFTVCDAMNKTCLHYACEYERLELVARLCDRRFNLKVRDKHGYQPIHYAASNTSPNVIEYLVENGCNPNLKYKGMKSPFAIAVSQGSPEVVDYLISCGVSCDQTIDDDDPALIWAAKNKRADIVSLLISKGGVHVDSTGKDGWTALHIAAEMGNDDLASLLCQM